jgi:hypothetical protein
MNRPRSLQATARVRTLGRGVSQRTGGRAGGRGGGLGVGDGSEEGGRACVCLCARACVGVGGWGGEWAHAAPASPLGSPPAASAARAGPLVEVRQGAAGRGPAWNGPARTLAESSCRQAARGRIWCCWMQPPQPKRGPEVRPTPFYHCPREVFESSGGSGGRPTWKSFSSNLSMFCRQKSSLVCIGVQSSMPLMTCWRVGWRWGKGGGFTGELQLSQVQLGGARPAGACGGP